MGPDTDDDLVCQEVFFLVVMKSEGGGGTYIWYLAQSRCSGIYCDFHTMQIEYYLFHR